jgi:DNA polymerase-3 subunit delta
LLYIFHGEDEYSLYEALEEIKKGLGERSMLDINTSVLEGGELTLERLRAAAETVPFMVSNRLVIINGLLGRFELRRGRTDVEKKGKGSQTSNGFQELVECIKNLPPTTVLVLADTIRIGANNPMLKELSPGAELRSFFPIKGDRLKQWIQKYLAGKKSAISAEAMGLLMELVGSDLRATTGELDKLVLYASGKTIGVEDVKAVVSSAQEFSVYIVVDAILGFQAAKAEQALRSILLGGISTAYLLVVLGRQVRSLILTKELKSQGVSDSEIQGRLGITLPFIWNKTRDQASRFSTERLIAVHRKLLETDLAIKTGKYDDELALNVLIAELCQR